ncbi:nucleolar protein 58 [Toxorhynchites rutilus septentrionalis]|uniref:nucleolar protein 58 n=1 Tax=Toxorhynchites rutilus septentrionalis TaxID=329112 RepID=UPI0024791113|nr:nucleolar protein 58 [Toxorhynchites rutilus septentrionalis]
MAVFGPNKPRKIPVPKRHGVRDPLKKLAEREAAIKDKINNPPKERDVQEVSNRFKRFVQLKEQTQNHALIKRQKQQRERKRASLQVGSSVIKQLPKEPEQAFLERVNRVQQDRVVEAEMATKYNVEIDRDESTGAVKLKKKKSYEIDELLKRKAEEANGHRKFKKPKEVKKKPTLAEKKALKKKKIEDKKRKEDELLLQEYQMDSVQFGEVVHGPPTLNTKPRHAEKLDGAPRPGKKRLLLHTLLAPQNDDEDEQKEQPQTKKSKKVSQNPTKVDLKGKRRKLPVATRMKLEKEQQNVIEIYRQMKKASK